MREPRSGDTATTLDALLAEVRASGMAAISGSSYMVRGVEALAAPVFNFKNEISLTLVVVGVEGSMDLSPDSALVSQLRQAAQALSMRMGATLLSLPQ